MTRKKHGISIAVKGQLDPDKLKAPKPAILGEQVLHKINDAKQKIAQQTIVNTSLQTEALPQINNLRVSSATRNKEHQRQDVGGRSGENNQSFRSIPPPNFTTNSSSKKNVGGRNDKFKMSHSMLSKHGDLTMSQSPSGQVGDGTTQALATAEA